MIAKEEEERMIIFTFSFFALLFIVSILQPFSCNFDAKLGFKLLFTWVFFSCDTFHVNLLIQCTKLDSVDSSQKSGQRETQNCNKFKIFCHLFNIDDNQRQAKKKVSRYLLETLLFHSDLQIYNNDQRLMKKKNQNLSVLLFTNINMNLLLIIDFVAKRKNSTVESNELSEKNYLN